MTLIKHHNELQRKISESKSLEGSEKIYFHPGTILQTEYPNEINQNISFYVKDQNSFITLPKENNLIMVVSHEGVSYKTYGKKNIHGHMIKALWNDKIIYIHFRVDLYRKFFSILKPSIDFD